MELYDKNIPILEMTIEDEENGLYAISLVKEPAMEVSWITANKPMSIKCQIVEEEQRIVICVIARANFPFLQYSPDWGYFYALLSKDTIKKMTQKLLKDGYQNAINIEHRPNSFIEGVEMQQIFIKDVENGLNPVGFEDIEDGSLMAVYKIENDEVWSAIKQGIFTSVSIEGLFRPHKEETIIDNGEDLWKYLENYK